MKVTMLKDSRYAKKGDVAILITDEHWPVLILSLNGNSFPSHKDRTSLSEVKGRESIDKVNDGD